MLSDQALVALEFQSAFCALSSPERIRVVVNSGYTPTTLMAVPLSRVNPRQGRFLKLLPAILLYMAYLTILISARGSLEKGKLPPALGLWWVHGVFLMIGLGLLYWEPIRLKMKSRRGLKELARG